QDEARPVAVAARVEHRPRLAAEPADDDALVLRHHPNEGTEEEQNRRHDDDDEQPVDGDHAAPPSPAFSTVSVSPFTSTTRTRAPSSTGAPRATARHSSPWTS